jgi:hypothetical protein
MKQRSQRMKKGKKPQDSTMRNVRAANKRLVLLEAKMEVALAAVAMLIERSVPELLHTVALQYKPKRKRK